jgi:hypothetical protein
MICNQILAILHPFVLDCRGINIFATLGHDCDVHPLSVTSNLSQANNKIFAIRVRLLHSELSGFKLFPRSSSSTSICGGSSGCR